VALVPVPNAQVPHRPCCATGTSTRCSRPSAASSAYRTSIVLAYRGDPHRAYRRHPRLTYRGATHRCRRRAILDVRLQGYEEGEGQPHHLDSIFQFNHIIEDRIGLGSIFHNTVKFIEFVTTSDLGVPDRHDNYCDGAALGNFLLCHLLAVVQ
jgi:hypothetical protein